MDIICPNCGQMLEIEEVPAIGRHLLCPLCDVKFSYTPQDMAGNSEKPNDIESVEMAGTEDSCKKIKTACPHCGTAYDVEADYIGETATCGTCGNAFVVKEAQAAEISEEASSDEAAETSGKAKVGALRAKTKTAATMAKENTGSFLRIGWKGNIAVAGLAALVTVCGVMYFCRDVDKSSSEKGDGEISIREKKDGKIEYADGFVETIPYGMKKVSEESFKPYDVDRIQKITIPNSVTEIKYGVFNGHRPNLKITHVPDATHASPIHKTSENEPTAARKHKAAITLPPGTPSELLLKYSEQGETAYVEAVLDQNPALDVNRPRTTGQKTALYLACENGFSDIVELLLKKNADATICDSIRQGFNVQCYSPFTIAAKNGHRSVCQILLASGKVDIESRDTENRTALYAAAANNQASVVQFLCESEAKVNIHGRGGFTPLTVAAFDGHVEVIKTLLKYGRELDLEMRDKGTFNATPLYHAAFKNHPEVVEVLCKAKAKVNIHESSGCGNTPLTAAASQGYVEVVKSLLKYGDGLNLEMKDGLMSYTPLYFAASNNHLEIVEILCKAGADVNAICGVLRETPLGTARRRGYAEVVKILERYK